MGTALLFIAGDVERLRNAVDEADWDILDDPDAVTFTADLSLHIQPRDLELLARLIAPTGTWLTPLVDHPDRGMLLCDDPWRDRAADLAPAAAPALARSWFQAMEQLHGQALDLPDNDAHRSVEDLLQACRISRQSQARLIHVWYL